MSKKDPENQPSLEDLEFADTLRELGIGEFDYKRRVTAREMLYLIDRCPFLQMMDSSPQLDAEIGTLTLVDARSGWKIHNYGNALSSSPGNLLFGGGDFRIATDDNEGGAGGTVINPGKGTIINQSVVTAQQMVQIALEQGWSGVKIVDGHPLMVWAAWMETLDNGMELEGYTPSQRDIAKRERIKRSRDAQSTRQFKP